MTHLLKCILIDYKLLIFCVKVIKLTLIRGEPEKAHRNLYQIRLVRET